MNIYDEIQRMADEPGTYDEKLYRILQSPAYSKHQHEVHNLGEGMSIIHESINGWWKPRFLLNNEKKEAYEIMTRSRQLLLVQDGDIDWDSIAHLPEKAIERAKAHSFVFPSSVSSFQHGVSLVTWQLIPDGRYYMDDDGYGMTDDEETDIYGFIDKEAQVIVKFQAIKGDNLSRLRAQAEQLVKQRGTK